MSYNIHHGANEQDSDRLDSMALFVGQQKVDIVGLQEVDSLCKRSGSVDQAKLIAERNGLYYAFGRHRRYDGGSYGQAILSRFSISEVRNYNLPTAIDGDKGTVNFIVAVVEIEKGKKVQVSVAHLDYRHEASRIKQANLILDYLKDSPYPNILLGDMNSYGDSKPLEVLYSRFDDLDPLKPFTFPATGARNKIDYMLTERGRGLTILNSEAIQVRLSDHLPLLSKVLIK